jgi:hypothetical protein
MQASHIKVDSPTSLCVNCWRYDTRRENPHHNLMNWATLKQVVCLHLHVIVWVGMMTRFRLGDQGNTVRFVRLAINYSILNSDQKIYAVCPAFYSIRTTRSCSESEQNGRRVKLTTQTNDASSCTVIPYAFKVWWLSFGTVLPARFRHIYYEKSFASVSQEILLMYIHMLTST